VQWLKWDGISHWRQWDWNGLQIKKLDKIVELPVVAS
jgi:hypothetical protein